MKYQIIWSDGSFTAYHTQQFASFPAFCEAFFSRVCAFPQEVQQIRKLSGNQSAAGGDYDDFDEIYKTAQPLPR